MAACDPAASPDNVPTTFGEAAPDAGANSASVALSPRSRGTIAPRRAVMAGGCSIAVFRRPTARRIASAVGRRYDIANAQSRRIRGVPRRPCARPRGGCGPRRGGSAGPLVALAAARVLPDLVRRERLAPVLVLRDARDGLGGARRGRGPPRAQPALRRRGAAHGRRARGVPAL